MAQNDTIRTPSLKVGKDEVAGSNPAISSIKTVRNDGFSYDFGRFLQDWQTNPANLLISHPKTGFLSHNPSHKGTFLDFSYYYMCPKSAIT